MRARLQTVSKAVSLKFGKLTLCGPGTVLTGKCWVPNKLLTWGTVTKLRYLDSGDVAVL